MDPSQVSPQDLADFREFTQLRNMLHRAQPDMNRGSAFRAPPPSPTEPNPPSSTPTQSIALSQPLVAPTAPPITRYQSRRTSQLPPAPLGHPSALVVSSAGPSQPILGFNSLSVSLAGQVNQQRLASAATRIPRQPALPVRGRRVRGPAIHPPVLPSARGRRDVLTACSTTTIGETGLRTSQLFVRVKIYPPQVRFNPGVKPYLD
jgi:hypothetical protein